MAEKKELRSLFPTCAVVNNKLFYLTDVEHIFEIVDVKNGMVKFMDDPQGYVPGEWTGTDSILRDKKNFFLLEQNGKRIMKYSPSDYRCLYININLNDYVCSNFAGATIYNEWMYLFPRYRDGIIKVDLNSVSLENKGRLCPDIKYKFDEKEEIPSALFACSYQIENHMWIFTEKAGIVVDYDIAEEKFDRYTLPKTIKSCVRVEYMNGLFYILTMEGKIYTWSPDKQLEQKLYDLGQEKEYPYFGTIVIANEQIWVLPLYGKDVCVIDMKTGKHIIYNNYPIGFSYYAPENWGKYYSYCTNGDYYYFAMHSGNYILTINKKSGQEQWIKPTEIKEEKKNFYLRNHNRDKLNHENLYFDMSDFLKVYYKKSCTQEKRMENNIGLLIWSTVEGE